MFTKRFTASSLLLAAVLIVSACGPSATPTANEPDYPIVGSEEPRTYEAYEPTEAPSATEALNEFSGGNQGIPAEAPAKDNNAYSVEPSVREREEEPTPDSMLFQDYGTNPMVETDDDHLSTFAMDVDTGSYSIARNYIQQGNLPPQEAVRAEEFINYFEQGYPIPSERQTFGINLDGAPSPFTQTERYQMLRVGIQGYDVPKSERKDAALTFVIDVSGSMDRENRLELVKDSLALLVKQLDENDRVSIVVYGSEARVVLEPTPGDEHRKIQRVIDELHPEGSTNAEAGIRLGYQMADEAYRRNGINRVIICSDGVANVGETGPGSIWEEVERYAGKEIFLTTVGFGLGNYNDVLMEQLADQGNGFYAYVDNMDEARNIFVEKLTGTLQTIALDAKVQVDFNADVVDRYRLVGYENRAVADDDFRNDKVDAGEIGAGHSVTALYEIKLRPEATGRIATVQIRWEDPDSREVNEISETIDTNDIATSFDEADPHFQWTVVVGEFAEILHGSRWAEDASLDDLLEEAERISRMLEETAEVEELVNLIRDARRMLR